MGDTSTAASNTIMIKANSSSLKKKLIKARYLILMFIPGLLYYIIFKYWPMYGVIIAFKKYSIIDGILGSDWVGLKYFAQFFRDPHALRVIKNTFLLSFYSLIFSFPCPIILAILLNEIRSLAYKRTVQTIIYLPHFISEVIVIGILVNFLSPTHGVINNVIRTFGFESIYFMGEPQWFRVLYIASGIWKDVGWGAIIYIAALAGINPELYEAAIVDGANRWHKIKHITIPGILPTVTIMLILRLGHLLSVGFEKVLLMYSPATYETADIISTYVYRLGILEANFSLGTAVDLMNNVVNLILLVLANYISKKTTENSLW